MGILNIAKQAFDEYVDQYGFTLDSKLVIASATKTLAKHGINNKALLALVVGVIIALLIGAILLILTNVIVGAIIAAVPVIANPTLCASQTSLITTIGQSLQLCGIVLLLLAVAGIVYIIMTFAGGGGGRPQ